MHTYTAARIVDSAPKGVESAIAAVVAARWGELARRVASSSAAGSVVAISTETDAVGPDVWLTWRVEATGARALVTLVLDELDTGPDPTDGLEELLGLIEREIAVRRAA